MKLRAGDLRRALAKPGTVPRGLLIYGEDPAEVADLRSAAIVALGGPRGEADMRIARVTAQEARSDPEAVRNALMQRGFFPGPQVVVVGEATDGMAESLAAAALAAPPGEAFLIATAGILPARSPLRRRFEGDAGLAAVACYAEPADSGEIVARLRDLGLARVEPAAAEALARLSSELDRSSLQQLLAKLAIYKGAETDPLTSEDVGACAPPGEDADLDDVGIALLAKRPDRVMATLSRLLAAGTGEVAVAIAVARLFRQVFEARLAMDSERLSADAALGRLQPPLRLPTRRAAAGHLSGWSRTDIERALSAIHGLDAALRSDIRPPAAALIERTLLRVALGGRG